MPSKVGVDQLKAIGEQFGRERRSACDRRSIEELRARYLSRKSGLLTLQLQHLRDLPADERAEFGRIANALKSRIEAAIATSESEMAQRERESALEREALDVTLPGNRRRVGHRHPLTIVREAIERIFVAMGYTVEDGPEVETVYYNFEALNIPEEHPARNAQDTFYISDTLLLRTHTSPVQVRTMERTEPPLRIICPGRVFRRDNPDATHSPTFHQFEGLVVGEGITFADLRGTLERFHEEFFGEETRTRFRPSYFPFTEPSAEVDISCIFCEGQGCRICKKTGWIELMGSGMVNPALYQYVGYDADRFSGFAFGGGIERYAMLKYNIKDMQLLYQNDLRFLAQFP